MPLYASIESSVTILRFITVGMRQEGVYCLRLSLVHPASDKLFKARPFSTMLAWGPRSEQLLEACVSYEEGCYYSPCYNLRYESAQTLVSQVAFFRAEISCPQNLKFSWILSLRVQLLFWEQSTFSGDLKKGYSVLGEVWIKSNIPCGVHSYLPVIFEGTGGLVLLQGLVSATLLQFKYKNNKKNSTSFRQYIANITNGFELVGEFYRCYLEQAAKQYALLQSVYNSRSAFLKIVEREIRTLPAEQETQVFQIVRSGKEQYLLSQFNEWAKQTYSLWNKLQQMACDRLPEILVAEKVKYRNNLYQHFDSFVQFTKPSAGQLWDKDKFVNRCESLAAQIRSRKQRPRLNLESNLPLGPDQYPVLFEEAVLTMHKEERPQFIFVLVSGFQATTSDLDMLRLILLQFQAGAKVVCAEANLGRTTLSIDTQGKALAKEVTQLAAKYSKRKINFVAHSLGGLIVRAMVSHLQQEIRLKLHMYMSLSSPHLGFTYGSTPLQKATLWYLNTVEKATSIEQLSMEDKELKNECYLFQLSKNKAFTFFSKVILVSSAQDGCVPLESARVEWSKQAAADKDREKGGVYCCMVENILKGVKPESLSRLEVCFKLQPLELLTGRTAHMNLVQHRRFLQILGARMQRYLN